MSNFKAVFNQINQKEVNAQMAKAGQDIPPGFYTGKHIHSDCTTYQTEEGAVYPKFSMSFEILTAPGNPALIGRRHTRFFRLGPSQIKGVEMPSIDGGDLKSIWNKLFAGQPTPSLADEDGNPVLDTEAFLTRIADEGLNAIWEFEVKQKGNYTNTYLKRIIPGA